MKEQNALTIKEISTWLSENNISIKISYIRSRAAFSVVANHNGHIITSFGTILEDTINKMVTSVEQHLKTCVS